MKSANIRLTSVALAALGLVGAASVGRATVELRPQEASFWCWAAAGQMVMESLAPEATQAEQARRVIAGCTSTIVEPACDNPYQYFGKCNRPGTPKFEPFQITADPHPSPLEWWELKNELDSCRPVIFGWCVEGIGEKCPQNPDGHWMVAAAADVCPLSQSSGVRMVKVYNPAPCCAGQSLWIPYTLYEHGNVGLGFWENHYRVRPKGQQVAADSPECRLTPSEGTALASFQGNEGDALAAKVLDSCFPDAGAWASSALLRPELSPAALDGEPVAQRPTRRVYVDRARLASLGAFAAMVQTPRLWVYPMKIGNELVANVVLEELGPRSYRLVAIEDSLTARRLQERKRAIDGDTAGVEVVVVQTGDRFLLVGSDAVVTTGEFGCKKAPLVGAATQVLSVDVVVGAILAR